MNTKHKVWFASVAAIVFMIIGVSMLWRGVLNSHINASMKSKNTQENVYVTAGPFKVSVALTPDPPRAGNNTITVMVRDAKNTPIQGVKVRALAQMAAMGSMPEMRSAVEFSEIDAGVFSGTLLLSMEGEWPLAVDIDSDAIGHGDLIFNLATGRKGLELATATSGDVAHYTCSMHPSVKNATPGICPICGMDLVPVTHSELNAGVIQMDERRRQLIGVTIDEAKRKRVRKTIRAAGRITYDETRLQDISLKYDAWIGTMSANYVGATVKRGEPLFTLYSPELLAAQEEFIETTRRLKERGIPDNRLVDAATRKLRLWDLTAEQITRLQSSGKSLEYMPVISSVNGVVIHKNAVDGSAVKAGMPIMRIADLSSVWAEAQIYDHEIPLVTVGSKASVEVTDGIMQEYEGSVNYVYPFMEGDTRTARVRVVLNNKSGNLRPDMFVNIKIRVDLGERLVVPESAVLYAGQSRVVFLDEGEGRIKPQRVTTGVRNRDYIEIVDGLHEGQKIITSGNFLIAAEAKLKAGINQW